MIQWTKSTWSAALVKPGDEVLPTPGGLLNGAVVGVIAYSDTVVGVQRAWMIRDANNNLFDGNFPDVTPNTGSWRPDRNRCLIVVPASMVAKPLDGEGEYSL